MPLQTGEILDGKYRIVRELGSGSMGAVYEGAHVGIKRKVAIKVLLPAVAERKDTVQRFEREAQAAGRIGSEHIVEVVDLGTLADGGFYMVMEFLEGETLGSRIRSRGRLPPRDLVPIIQQLLTGLEGAHTARIIHRDLKPDNVFLVADHAGAKDFVKILDFGVSKFNPLTDDNPMSMTKTGTVMGTPFYMAPEQAKGSRDVDPRSDLYSVGVILYEAVTGQVPFHAGTFNELIFKIVLETPPAPETFVPDLDPAFSRIIRRAMSRESTDRYNTAADFRDALSVWLHTGRDNKQTSVPPPPLGSGEHEPAATVVVDPKRTAGGTVIAAPEPPGTALMVPEDEPATLVRPSPLDPRHMPTPVGARPPPSERFVPDSVWPIAGVPAKRHKTGLIVAGAATLLIGGAVALLLFRDAPEDANAAVANDESGSSESGSSESDADSSAETSGETASETAAADTDADRDADAASETAPETAETGAETGPGPDADTSATPPVPRANYRDRPPASAPKPRATTKPKAQPRPKPSAGRRIMTEL